MTGARPGRYEEALATLRARIHTGAYQPGDPLPTESALTKDLGVGRHTLRRAVEALSREGVVQQRGAPHRPLVLGPLPHRELDAPEAFDIVGLVTVEISLADQRTTAAMSLEPAAPVLSRRMIAADRSGPYGLLTVAYEHEVFAHSQALTVPGDGRALDLEEVNRYAYGRGYWYDWVTSRHATPDEARRLEVQAGHIVTEHSRLLRDDADQPIVYATAVWAGVTIRFPNPYGTSI